MFVYNIGVIVYLATDILVANEGTLIAVLYNICFFFLFLCILCMIANQLEITVMLICMLLFLFYYAEFNEKLWKSVFGYSFVRQWP